MLAERTRAEATDVSREAVPATIAAQADAQRLRREPARWWWPEAAGRARESGSCSGCTRRGDICAQSVLCDRPGMGAAQGL